MVLQWVEEIDCKNTEISSRDKNVLYVIFGGGYMDVTNYHF